MGRELMDTQYSEERKAGSIWTEMGPVEWLALVMPVFIIILGIGIWTGIFFTNKYAQIAPPLRWPVGVGFCLWGLIRIALIFRRLNRQKRENQHG
jgi:hypothetical protein